MRLSTKGRYAVIAMMDIALHEKQGTRYPGRDIAMPGHLAVIPGTVVFKTQKTGPD